MMTSSPAMAHQLVAHRRDANSVVIWICIDDGEGGRPGLHRIKHQCLIPPELSHLQLGALGLERRIPGFSASFANPPSSSPSPLATDGTLSALFCSLNNQSLQLAPSLRPRNIWELAVFPAAFHNGPAPSLSGAQYRHTNISYWNCSSCSRALYVWPSWWYLFQIEAV